MTVQEWLGEDNQLGIDIWERKYRYNSESFEQWLERVSAGDNRVRNMIINKEFLFGGRILSNRGLDKSGTKVTYSNCYVIEPPEDNIESIFECAKKLARTYSFGGGCGIDIGKLAPRGAKVHNTAKETSGAVSFMDLYSLVTGLIGQNGRRGALMISIPCNHPDVEEFIGVKSDLERVTKANISIRITDDFIEAVKNNADYELSFTRSETGETISKAVNAKQLFNKIAEMNWDYAEPGALFWDRIESYNLLSNDPEFKYAGTNPCAEEPLPAGGSCLLGSINLSAFVGDDKNFDYDRFSQVVRDAVDALNDVLDEGMHLHPLEEQRNSVRDWRQIGLGIMGLADMLIKMEVAYGSAESIEICDKIGRIMAYNAIWESAELATHYREPYPKYKGSVRDSTFYTKHIERMSYVDDLVKGHGIRNSQLLTIAPTGTLSTMLRISGGIEPVFANYYERTTQSLYGKDVVYKVYTKIVDDYMKANNITDDNDLPEWFVTAQTLNYKDRVNMQAVWQSHIDASISSTVNVPNDFTKEQTYDLYMLAHDKGLKGITIFRDGCKRTGILNTSNANNMEPSKTPEKLSRGVIIKANDNVIGKKRKLITGCGSLHCTAFFDPDTGELMETYLSKGSTGGCNNFMIGLSRMISLSARSGCDVHTIVDQLNSCGVCPSYAVRKATKNDTSKGSCCPIAVANALLDMYNELQEELGLVSEKRADINSDETSIPDSDECVEQLKTSSNEICPECGEPLFFEGGCNICKNCGWSKCN